MTPSVLSDDECVRPENCLVGSSLRRYNKSKHRALSNQKGSSSRRKKADSAVGDSEGTVTSITSSLRSTQSMRNLLIRPSSSTFSSTRTRSSPFCRSLPPEMWVLIFQYTIFPPTPSLALSTVSSDEHNPSTFTSHSFLHFPYTQGHPPRNTGEACPRQPVRLTDREASLLATPPSDVSIRSADVSVGAGVVEEPATKSKVLGMVMMGKWKENERVAGFEGIRVSATTSHSYSTSPPSPPPSLSSSHIHPHSPSSTSSAIPTGAYALTYDNRAIRRRMRRQHTETRSLDRCSPQDGLTVLTHAPALQVFSDSHSIRRTSGFSLLVFV
ncbi:hypothetical protein BKA70DRAFT_1435786 [Coprinopsis sp. MPI-PUGE-AT-0042]|nr:hypothetical protein BKA70DRAFT_1435786 [Coprinopsis sp. MPI-PUGE-AT-0042]